jgi:hypothetical protein
MEMDNFATARHLLEPYVNHQPPLQVANPIAGNWDEAAIKSARQLETKISINSPSEDNLSLSLAKAWKTSPEFWVAGGDIVQKNTGRPLTCILFAYLCVYALKQAPKFTAQIEIVEIKSKVDNHYVLVIGRRTGTIDGKLSDWNDDSFIIDLWGSRQGLGNVISRPPAIIVADMKDYPRKTVVTIPPWS